MLVAKCTNGQQLTKTAILSLNNSTCPPLGSVGVQLSTTPSNTILSPNNFNIMSSIDVSTPSATTTISPCNKNNNQCNSSSNNSGSQKYESPYSGNVASPSNSDGNNSQHIEDSNSNCKNKNSNTTNLSAVDATSRAERDSIPNISAKPILRQGSVSVNTCCAQFNESSSNSGDSSSSSSNTSPNDNNKSNDEEKLNNNLSKKSLAVIKDEERDKSSSSSSSSGIGNSALSLSNQTSVSNLKTALPAANIKDEKDLVKKEETSLSPSNMSPVGFGSIVVTQINEDKSNDSSCEKRMGLPANVSTKNDDVSVNQTSGGLIVSSSGANNLNLISNCNTLNSNTNPLNSKSNLDGFCSDISNSTPIVSNTQSTACNIPLNAPFIINNLSNTNGTPQSSSGGINIISGGGSSINNCVDYMQQQNHIFVFSTQLANKGAEAVLAGQFPTIIAYHCTQPATKSFFEDFFLKNPMKMTKLQRQNTLNIMGGMQSVVGGSISGGQLPWLTGNCNSIGKLAHKLPLNKSVETITSSSSNAPSGAVLNETDILCWDQSRSVIDSPVGDSGTGLKILENSENSVNTAKSACTSLSNDDTSGIPSLQGVKVPDENLTPQQRQHREEQLAKLKKMNQFLFPENGGSDFHSQATGSNPLMTGKMQVSPDTLAATIPGNAVALINMQNPNIGSKLNAASMHNISGSLINHAKTNASNSQLDNMPNLGEDIIMAADIIGSSGCGSNEMAAIPSSIKQSCMPNMNNSNAVNANSGRGISSISGANLNIMNNNCPIGLPPGSLLNDSNNSIISNNTDVLSSFNSNHCPSSGQEGGDGGNIITQRNMNAAPSQPSDINSAVSMSQMEWSKLHHHIYEERLKTKHPNSNTLSPEISGNGPNGCQQTLTRCNSTGIGSMSHRNNPNTNSSNRSIQGPPPPYHPTQRSASVPIATQSPNPSSPSNLTSNMSLPSPRPSNAVGGILSSTTSPSMDVMNASSTSTPNTNSTPTTTTAAGGGTSSGNTSVNKNTFSQQGSPTPASGLGNTNRNRSTVNILNSNPTTPLSHISPKDIETKLNMNTTSISDHKATRSNSQRSRSPLLSDVCNNNIEPRFPSPGLNFTPSSTVVTNNQNLSNNFKNQNLSLEQRQNLQQMPPQFCRRSDNMPLNPNRSRNTQTKISNSFDPISSLAQMSQQLTGGGVGLNSGSMGSSPNNVSGVMGTPGSVNDININGLMAGPLMSGPVDPGMEHCNQNPNVGVGSMGISGLGVCPTSVTGPFGPGNCNMMSGNPGSICQRLLNPKLCGSNMSGGFNSNQVSGIGMREIPSSFSGMMPTHRMMNHRMSANFGNFNVSPNIQVKASTPNTIQYMPVRPQNNNSNMRVPPSLEFLQRYANPQIMGNSSGSGGAATGQSSSTSDIPAINGASELNKMPNTNANMVVNPNNMNQINFFGNCNQMAAMSNMGVGAGDQDDMQSSGMMSTHDPLNMAGPMLRGMRPMRQGGLQQGCGMNSGSRIQHPAMGNIPPNGLGNHTFASSENEQLECTDPTNSMYNNPSATGLYQHKNKLPPMGMSHGPSNTNSNNGNNNVLNDQNPSSNTIQNSVMIGSNSSILANNIPNSNGSGGPLTGPGNMGYKPFVGPTSNDLKYAQQYHSFQQQLYATSTRNQQPVGGQQPPPNVISPNSNPNGGFFVK